MNKKMSKLNFKGEIPKIKNYIKLLLSNQVHYQIKDAKHRDF
jgi:hypothetical protein